MVNICAEFQAPATWRDGVVNELRRQLDETRREAAELRLQVALGGAPATGRSFADVVAGRRDDVAVFSASTGVERLRGAHRNSGIPGNFKTTTGTTGVLSTRGPCNTGW
ncbi:hypothetical protein MRX96_020740 [Rhipicephalus microplus]